jgi:BlaI family transcriptional regulator, penicillinase repressor
MKTKTLGKLEQQIMVIMWKNKSCSTREVLNILEKNKKLAYTTVATILQRLYKKELLKRRKTSIGYIYSPKVSREKYSKNIANNFIANFVSSFGDTAIASFAEGIDRLPSKKRKDLLNLIKEYDRSNK